MDILAVFEHPGLFLVGGIWMLIHVILMVIVAKAIRAPYFFLAVGSKANIGGAASAPVVAAAFHPITCTGWCFTSRCGLRFRNLRSLPLCINHAGGRP